MKASKRLWHIAVLLIGIVTSVSISKDFQSHTLELLRHLQSGSWEIITDQSAIERLVRTKYAGSEKWAIHFTAASGQSFVLGESVRRETIRNIGHQTLEESEFLRFNSTYLYTSYGGFLAQSLLELTIPKSSNSTDPILLVVKELTKNSVGDPLPQIDPAHYSRAQDALAKLPNSSLLRKALSDFDEFGRGRSIEFPPYEVATVPSDDAPGEWDQQATTLPQSGKCKAKISSIADPNSQTEVYVALLPRLLEVNLDRRWLSDALLDEALGRKGPLTSKYFAFDGELRLVPSRLWVLLPADVWIEPETEKDRAHIVNWGNDNNCCRIVCNESAILLSPTTFRENKDKTFTLRRADKSPLLYAIVSRRRLGF